MPYKEYYINRRKFHIKVYKTERNSYFIEFWIKKINETHWLFQIYGKDKETYIDTLGFNGIYNNFTLFHQGLNEASLIAQKLRYEDFEIYLNSLKKYN